MAKETGTRTDSGKFAKGASGNPGGRPPIARVGDLRWDGWQSSITGIGSALFDKRMSAVATVEMVTEEEAQVIYRGDDMGAKAVDIWPNNMLREGFDLNIAKLEGTEEIGDEKLNDPVETEKEPPKSRQDARRRARMDAKMERRLRTDAAAKKLKSLSTRALAKWKKLKGKEKFKEALAYSRAYGGGAVLMGARDGATDWSKPLDVEKITGGKMRGIDFLTSLEPRELTPISWYDDPQAENFGEPSVYEITANPPGTNTEKPTPQKTIKVHASRLIIFQGTKVSRNQVSIRSGWADSIFTRVKPILRDFNMGWSGAAIILQEFSLATMEITDLEAYVNAGPSGQTKLLARMAAVQLGRSVAKLTLIGKGEKFSREFANISGLAELLEKFMERLAAALDVPVTLLMGMAPAGLNATGDADVRSFYDKVKAAQIDLLEPELHRVFEIILRSLNNGKEPAEWSIEFRKLWQETPKEQAETRKLVLDGDAVAIMNGIYTANEARTSHFGGDKFSAEITIEDDSDNDGADFNPSDEDMAAYKASMGAPANGNESAAPGEEPKLGPDGKPLPTEGNEMPKMGPDGKPLPPDTHPAPVGAGMDPAAAPAGKIGEVPLSAPEKPVSNSALNGAQGAMMLAFVKAYTSKEVDRQSAKTMLLVSLPITDAIAESMLGDANFVAAPPAPMGGGFGAKPGAPGDDGGDEPPKPGAPAPKKGEAPAPDVAKDAPVPPKKAPK